MSNVSKRGFLLHFLPRKKPEENQNNEDPWKDYVADLQFSSRRNFLKFLAGLGATFAAGVGFIKLHPETTQRKEHLRQPEEAVLQKEIEEKTEETRKEIEASYMETAKETSLIFLANLIGGAIGKFVLGVNLSGSSSKVMEKKIEQIDKMFTMKQGDWQNLNEEEQKIIMRKLLKAMQAVIIPILASATVIAPTLEEMIHRYLPAKIFISKDDKRMRWDIGIPSSAIFAFMHGSAINEEEFEPLKKAIPPSIPFTQFIAGIFFWYLMREKGISHSILAHFIHNSMIAAIAMFFGTIAYYTAKTNKSDKTQDNGFDKAA